MSNVTLEKENFQADPLKYLRPRIHKPGKKNQRLDKFFESLIFVFSAVMVIPLVAILVFITYKGISHINLGMFIHDQRNGGILNAVVGTLLMVLLATIIAVPIAILTGAWLAETGRSKRSDLVRIIVDVMQGVPSIILGIVAYAWLVVPLRGFSGLAGSLSLSIMMLPIIIKNTEESLVLVPGALREGGYSLGIPRHLVMLQVIIPAGISGISTGVLVAVSRVMGETAPLLFTAFGSRDLNFNLLKPMEALPPLIYKYASSPVDDWVNTAWAASFLLVVFVVGLNILTRVVTNKWKVRF